MNKIIIDTSPVIFLSKAGCLDVLMILFRKKITVSKSVINELYKYPIPAEEDMEINKFLKNSHIVNTPKKIINSNTLSSTDNKILTYSILNKYNLIITDDSFIRKIAKHENISSIGTLGILLNCMDKKIFSKAKVKNILNDLIEKHNFRISLNVYKDALQYIDRK